MKVKVKKLPHAEDLPLPFYATPGSSCMDLLAAVEGSLVIEPLKRVLVPTGIAIELPEGLEAQVRPRSGLALKYGITVLNAPGTIDSDYRGEIKVILINLGEEPFLLQRGERIAQLCFCKVVKIEWEPTENLSPSERGEEGFGSTGGKV
ncbi:deoxyuridine 5'-triphosphate nucleotidohydrolase Dut [Thermocrinis albus DSM 14484]|uniref:Deoxyuridine 5'-triphosphate nucleotidohydrolase n=1 Tax=Thermocrinis albus (strain DSM 14484 / JCM 11386 / HI 11/12) TaxID=638303 RepID=D3SQG8_THEAH|nr:dUTP diphosphatase [Thermocrinis albus]ADC89405.1 deoxyuridine 5'-triphosphate nucleotidohydrolase Dut [Thermocrinis albus DSM 14484]